MTQHSKEYYRNALLSAVVLRAKAKNISQKEALIQIRDEMRHIISQNQNKHVDQDSKKRQSYFDNPIIRERLRETFSKLQEETKERDRRRSLGINPYQDDAQKPSE